MAKKAKEISTATLLEQQIVNATVLAQALQAQTKQTSAQAMVGIRNISDMTVGIVAAYGATADIHLHPGIGAQDPNSMTVIPFSWWRELRKSRFVDNGILVRDDSIMGEGYLQAPTDRPEDLAPNHGINAIYDPKEWIESRTETQLREDLPKIVAINSLRRIRRAVDDKIKELASAMPDVYRDTTPATTGFMPKGGWDLRKVRGYEQLPALYRLVDDLTTRLIEEKIA